MNCINTSRVKELDKFIRQSDLLQWLEIQYVINDLKPMVRISILKQHLNEAEQLLKYYSLYYKVGKTKILTLTDTGKNISNLAVKLKSDALIDNYSLNIYVSKDKSLLIDDEYQYTDQKFGEILGYPKCCTEFYIKNKSKAIQYQLDFSPLAINSLETAPFYNNVMLRTFNIGLLSHFPCSLHCKESMEIAKRNLKLIQNIDNDLGKKFVESLSSVVIFTNSNGIFYLDNYVTENNILGDKIKFTNVNGSVCSNLYKDLEANKELVILDYDKIKVNDKVYFGDGLKVVKFS